MEATVQWLIDMTLMLGLRTVKFKLEVHFQMAIFTRSDCLAMGMSNH